MKRVILGLMVILCVRSAAAQAVLPEEGQEKTLGRNVFGLGMAGGLVSGFGLSFRHHLPSEWSYQLVSGVIKVDDRLHYNIGGEVHFDLLRSEQTRFFLSGGMGYFYSGPSYKNDLKGPFRMGFGLGAERGAARTFSATGELLFTYFSDGSIIPLPQIGFHYYFL